MSTPDSIFAANLAALARNDPELANRIRATERTALTWTAPADGIWSASVTTGNGKPLQLASRYDPMAEAENLIAGVDRQKHAGVFILGVGLGYHVQLAVKDLTNTSIVVVFEPDLSRLRAVLEKIDHSEWLGRPNVFLLGPDADRAGLLKKIEAAAAILTQGTVIVTHPATRQLDAEAVGAFSKLVTEAVAFCRINIATSLVNAARTVRNLTSNLAQYAAGANTNALYNAARGYPAVCVSAGPSLAKNVHQLTDPAVRRNVVVITAQTTLKPLLDRGIEPDFVTALDYHEISRRFYEGLPPLPRVTLVAEAKAHASVLDQYPGPIRVIQNYCLDRILGPLARPITSIKAGATVAHLSFYLAQHLGCDPIILIGQDLAFSDGLYYCPGTAIHEVWAPELSPFNTLEMFEWQRIVRHRGHLQKRDDVEGRAVFTDEQMTTYLGQFERDFAVAPQKVIDATEGGLAKTHTTRMKLAEALSSHATKPVPEIPLPPMPLDRGRLAETEKMIRGRIDGIRELRRLSEDTVPILRQMLEHQSDQKRMEKLFSRLDKNRKLVMELNAVFGIVNDLNTIGAFKRARADRAIQHASGDETERQRRQLERDLENVQWLVQACDEALAIFRDALARLEERSQTQAGKPQSLKT